MLLFFYLAFALFILHSALMSGSRVFAVCAVILLILPLCFFVLLLIQRRLTRAELSLRGEALVLSIRKKGILPVSGLRFTISFYYDQSQEGAVIKNSAASLNGLTEIAFYPELSYAGSGVFELQKCTISDYAGFFRLPLVRKKHPVRIPVDLMPQDEETLLEATGDPGLNYISEYTRTVSSPGDDASETFDIREYREGDRISRMHWKLSAKRETMMLREFSREDNARFLFLLSFASRTQEQFDRVVTNYYNLAAALPEEESAHVLVFEDPKGEITEIGVEDASQLENTVLSVFRAFAAEHSAPEEEEGEKGLFSPHSAEEILEEYHQLYGSRRFLREFTVTDEALSVLAERWNEDEDR